MPAQHQHLLSKSLLKRRQLKWLLRVALLLLALFILAGCDTLQYHPTTPDTKRKVDIDPVYYQECAPPRELTDSSESGLIAWLSTVFDSMKDCQEKTSAHIQLLKKLFPNDPSDAKASVNSPQQNPTK